VQAGNLRVLVLVLVFSELRESCWSCCGAAWLWWRRPRSQQRSAATTEQRTTSKLGMKTTRRTAVCVESRPSIERTFYRSVESWPSCFDRAPLGQVKNFHAKSSATDLGLKHRTKHHHPSFVKVGVAHLLREGYGSSGWQRRRIVVGRIITYVSVLRIRQCLLGPRMEEHKGNGGRMKTPAEAGLRIYGRLS
jgi:hypothetical protein